MSHDQVRCIKWSPDDTQIVSCSMDGAVYEWNVLTGKREKECVVKSSKYTSLAVTSDLRTTFVVSTDSTLSELFLAESNVICKTSEILQSLPVHLFLL